MQTISKNDIQYRNYVTDQVYLKNGLIAGRDENGTLVFDGDSRPVTYSYIRPDPEYYWIKEVVLWELGKSEEFPIVPMNDAFGRGYVLSVNEANRLFGNPIFIDCVFPNGINESDSDAKVMECDHAFELIQRPISFRPTLRVKNENDVVRVAISVFLGMVHVLHKWHHLEAIKVRIPLEFDFWRYGDDAEALCELKSYFRGALRFASAAQRLAA